MQYKLCFLAKLSIREGTKTLNQNLGISVNFQKNLIKNHKKLKNKLYANFFHQEESVSHILICF
jgi:hypothetical protein